MKANGKEIGRLLHQYERVRFEFYKDLTNKKFLLWQVVKRPLFYNLISGVFTGRNAEKKSVPVKSYVFSFLIFPFRLLWLRLKTEKVKAFIIGYEVYKFEKDADGKDINNFADHWCQLFPKNQRIYSERRTGLKDPANSSVKEDIDINFVNAIVGVGVRLAKKLRWSTRNLKLLSGDIAKYLPADAVAIADFEDRVRTIIVRFNIEYFLFSMIFKILRPEYLVVTDSVATGIMAAARRAGIKIIENQHGHFDNLKPDYMMDESTLGTIREKLILPDHVAVFGEYFGKALQKSSFWKKKEIANVGNVRIDKYRHEEVKRSPGKFVVLVPTQWNVLEETLDLLKELNQIDPRTNLQVLIKLHPREPKGHVKKYNDFAEGNPLFSVLDNQTSIYELFLIANMVIGFDSTSLFESVAFEIPTITIKSSASPLGMHTYIAKDDILLNAIRISDTADIKIFVANWIKDETFSNNWKKHLKVASNYLYSENCVENCKSLVYNV
jgi:hypothetical protein